MFCNPHEEKLVPNFAGEVRLSSPEHPLVKWLIQYAFRRRMDGYLRAERELGASVNMLLYKKAIGEIRISLQSDDASDNLVHFLNANLDRLIRPVIFLDSQDVRNIVDLSPLHPGMIPGIFHFKARCQVMTSPGRGEYYRISWLSPTPDVLSGMGFKQKQICMAESVGKDAINELGHRLAIFMMQIMEARLTAA